MKAVVQRVSRASVVVAGDEVGAIDAGLLVLLGVAKGDTGEQAAWMAKKIVSLRIFEDEEGRMNRSVAETGGSVLAVSQFTLLGDARKGRRPSFVAAAPPEEARALYEDLVAEVAAQGVRVATGVFQAHMEVSLVNDGPVTLILDTERS